MKILSISATFPSVADPSRGGFVKERLRALGALDGTDLRVLSPTPWFPPVRAFKKWYRWSQYPHQEEVAGIPTTRPRYFLPPKIGGFFHPQLMDVAIAPKVDQLYAEFKFDVIDAHWVYPAGAWAIKLGNRYGVPVVMTGRGEDIAKFPELPFVGKKIRWALPQAAGCIGVSTEISSKMIDCGARPDRVCTIPNGIDSQQFFPKERDQCRAACDLPHDVPVVLSVGDRLEIKGFHLVAQAMAEVRKRFPTAIYVIVGGPGRFGRDHTESIDAVIREYDLVGAVRMVGAKPHHELIDWYNSADLYVAMSSREGSPNVVLESLACGTPAIGTNIGGIADELSQGNVGRVVEQRTATAAANAIIAELERPRDRNAVANAMASRSWHATASQVRQFITQMTGVE